MMKSYIAIQSTLFNGVIDLVGYTDMQGNIRLTHTSIYAYMSRTFPQMSMEFDVRSTDVNHAVVVCRLRSKIFDGSVRTVTEIGETSASLLPDKFKGYPVQVAQYIAFDRAAIKYLGLPSNTYSTFEPPYFTENAIRIPDPANYVLGFGIFRNRTVQQAFEEAKYNEASHATMKPDVLADFIMKHIPNRMTVEDIISYIPDITDRMESEIRTLFPAGIEFGHAQIQNAFNIFDGRRKDLAREVKLNRAKISGYDFSIPVRASGEIREELASVLKEMGAYEEKIRAVRDFQARKTNRENILKKLKSLQEQYNAIHAVKPDSARKEYLDKRESELMQQADSCKKSIWELQSACNNLNRTVAALKEGLCPQVKGIKCTHDWTPVITQFESNVSQMNGNIASFQTSCDAAEKELLSVREEKAAYEANFRAYSDKCSKYQAFRALKESLMPLPEEPRMPEGNLEEKKVALDGELNGAITRENLLAVKNALPEQEEQLNVLEALTSAFSKKGSVMENNTKVYLGFFEQQMNESAIKLGYVISMEMENGLHVRIGRNGRTPVDVDVCSAGEKAVAIFLLLDLLNSFTGIRLLFFDEVEMLDNKVWEALLKLVEEKKGSYDHIVITGVNHDDTMEAVDRILK